MDFQEKTLNKVLRYQGRIFDVETHHVLLPNGNTSTRDIILHNGAVAVIALTKDQKMLFVKQFRKPFERTMLEIPAGKLDSKDEEPLSAAQRELNEETNYIAHNWEKLIEMAMTPGYVSEVIHFYVAKQLEKADRPLSLDEDEFVEVYALTLQEAKEKIATGEIYDAKTIYAILYWENLLLKGESHDEKLV